VIGAEQPVDEHLLVQLLAPHARQLLAQLGIGAHAGEAVLEALRLLFDAIHEDDAHAGEGVVIELADRLLHHVAPGELLGVERRAFLALQGKRHEGKPFEKRLAGDEAAGARAIPTLA
jgi:hypothetical protein